MDNGNFSNTGPDSLQSVPTPQQQPPTPTDSVTSFSTPKKSNGFKVFVIASIILLLVVWGFVGYLFLENKNMAPDSTANITATPIPTQPFSPSEIRLSNGSISRVTPFGETITLIDKSKYPETGITGFFRVVVSPDSAKLCFESIAPATNPALYISNVDGSEVSKIADNRNTCIWTTDSQKIVYVNTPIDTTSVDIYQYNIAEKTETNLTSDKQTATVKRQYSLSDVNNETVQCKYDILNVAAKKTSEGICSINLDSGAVMDNEADGGEN